MACASCAAMSRLGDARYCAACELRFLARCRCNRRALGQRFAGRLAQETLHNEDDELANIWHCGEPPRSPTPKPKLAAHEIIVSCWWVPTNRARRGPVRRQSVAPPRHPRPRGGRHCLLRKGTSRTRRTLLSRLWLVSHPGPPTFLPLTCCFTRISRITWPRGGRALGGVGNYLVC